MDTYSDHQLPKGRGTWLNCVVDSRDVRHSKPIADDDTDTGLGHSPSCTPVSGFKREYLRTSTPATDVDAMHHLTDMVGRLGAQIGESIVEKLMSAGVVNIAGDRQSTPTTQTTHSEPTRYDSSHVTVHVKSDGEFPTFKGDSTDKHSVQDWIDLTKTHLRKHVIPVNDQAEEIMSHLLGRARDVVKIALRSDPAIDLKETPDKIYDVLLHYFSEASSCLPLADFYATLPKHKENPVDYWIRLNKAADLALEGLRRQGKKTENINNEVALMFVKHCPDPELSCTLKCKPIHEWTSRDVQLRIDDYQRELRDSGRAIGTAQLKNHVISVTPKQPDVPPVNVAMPSQFHTQNPSLQAQYSVCPSNCPHPICVPTQGEPIHSLSPPSSAPAVAQNLQSQSDDRLLTRMVDIFQDMMDKLQQRNTRHLSGGGRFRRTPRERHPNQAVCKVCNDSSHNTISHCMSERLCFACFRAGHTRLNCPISSSSPSQSGGN